VCAGSGNAQHDRELPELNVWPIRAPWNRLRMNRNGLFALALALALALAACGTDSGSGVYTELHDATNNWNVGGTPEATGLAFTATNSIVIDGMVDDGHYDSEDLDNDAYTFEVTGEKPGTVTLTGSDANAALHFFAVSIINSDSHAVGHVKVGAPASVDLPIGTYTLEVHAQNPTPITASYPYTIELSHTGG
jgi:hypothetical protein